MDESNNEEEKFILEQKMNELQSISQSEAKAILQVAEEEVRDFLEGFSLAEEEAVAEEVDKLLNEIDSKSIISERLSDERQLKMEEALRKCMLVFTKQKVRNFAADTPSSKSAPFTVAETSSDDTKKNEPAAPKRSSQSAADALMIQMLQKKVSTLKKNIELSDQKSRSVNLQWVSDKLRYKEMLDKSQQLQDELRTRLQIMEKKARKLEQLDRDSNMIKAQPNDIKELENVKETLANVESELSEKKQAIVGLSVELSDRKLELSTAESKIDALTRRLEELSKSEEQLHTQIETLEKDGRNTMFKISDLQRNLADAKDELEEEKMASKRYRDRLEQQQAEFEEKINGYRVKVDELRQLVERIMDEKEALIRETNMKIDTLQRENGKLNQEKESLSRNMKTITATLQTIAKESQQLSTQMQQRDQMFVKRIDTTIRTTDYLKGEVKRLGNAVTELTASSNAKVEDAKRIMQNQMEHTASSLRMTSAKLELATNELQELRNALAQSAEEWSKERQKIQQDYVTATMTIQLQLEEIQKLKDGSSGISKEEMNELLEQQKVAFQDKIAEMRKQADFVINDLRDAREKTKTLSDVNRDLATKLQNLKEMNDNQAQQIERSSMQREDFMHQFLISCEIRKKELGEFQKSLASLSEQHTATISELARVTGELVTAQATIVTNERIVYTRKPLLPEDVENSSIPVYIETTEAGIQTDPMKTERERRHDEMQIIPGEEIVYGKIEALVKDSLITSNLYFSKESETFSNTYPIDENFLKDLVNSFVNMAQGIREMAKQVRAKDIESIVSAVAKDLIFKLDKARDESVLKIKAEQADVMAERIDETVQMMRRDKDAALSEQRESFERELAMAKSRTDKEIKRLEDMLSDQREMYRKELRKAREQWEKELDESDSTYEPPPFSSQLDLFYGIRSDEVDGDALQQSQQQNQQQQLSLQRETEMSFSNIDLGSPQGRTRSKHASLVGIRDADLDILKAQWSLELEDTIRKEIRQELEAERISREQYHKLHILKELGLDSSEIDKQLLELWKEVPEKFKDMNQAQMKEELLTGSLSHIGDVRMENFDRLRNKGFGTDDIIQLTIIEHHLRYDSGEINDDGSPCSPQQSRQYKMQVKSMEIQRNMLLQRIVQQTSILDLLSYLHATDVHMQLLSTLNAWKSLLYYSAGGIFKDVLIVHMEVLEKCIKASGGIKAALSNIVFMSPDSATDQWPQYFRVKALEIFRTQLLGEAKEFKKSMASALRFLQDKNTLSVLHGAKLGSTLQDSATATTSATHTVKREESMRRVRNDHSQVVGQLRKSFFSIEKLVPDSEDVESSVSSMKILPFPEVDAIQFPTIASPATPHQAVVSVLKKTPSIMNQTTNDQNVSETVVSSETAAIEPIPISSRTKRNSLSATRNSVSASTTEAVVHSPVDSITPSIGRKLVHNISAPAVVAHNDTHGASRASMSIIHDLQPITTKFSSKSISATQTPKQQTKVKQQQSEELQLKKRTVAPDLRKIAFENTFSYETSQNLSTPAGSSINIGESVPIVSAAVVVGQSFHPVLDEVFVGAVCDDAKKKEAFLVLRDTLQLWQQRDKVPSAQQLQSLLSDPQLHEVARLLQRDILAGKLSSVSEEIQEKMKRFGTIFAKLGEIPITNEKSVSLQHYDTKLQVPSQNARCTSNTEVIPSGSKQLTVQTFDCATQTPVYKEVSVIGSSKSKSRRPERSARNDLLQPPIERSDEELRRRGLPPGFVLANFRDDEFEVKSGLFLVQQATLESLLHQQDNEILNKGRLLSDLLQKLRFLPNNIFYCRGRRLETAVGEIQDLRDADDVLELPVISGCFPLIFPPVFPLQQGANLVCGYQYIGQGSEYVFGQLKKSNRRDASDEIVTLPHDLLLLQIADDLPLPYGIYPVQISHRLILSDDRDGADSDQQISEDICRSIPPGHELVQLLNCAIDFPVGLELAPGIRMAATPLNIVLPESVRLVKKDRSTPLPEFLAPIKFVSSEDEQNPRPLLRSGCVVVQKPSHCAFDLGMELLYRPPGFALPPGMSLVPVDDFPSDFCVPPNHDLVQLDPLFELPLGTRLSAAWSFYPRPQSMRLASKEYLVYPDLSLDDHSIPPLPHFACELRLPTVLPSGVTLPPRTRLVRLNIARLTPFALPEGCILAPGVVVVCPQQTIHHNSNVCAGALGHLSELRRPAVNALVVRREPGATLPPEIVRGSRSDLPSGLLLEEKMEVVRIPVRFELPVGVRIEANVTLGAHVQLAPGTRLQSGLTQSQTQNIKKEKEKGIRTGSAPYLTVVPWPHGICLPRGTELVRRPMVGVRLPFEYQEVHHCGLTEQLPSNTMLVRLPRKLQLQSLLEISEQLVFGVESVLDYHRALPEGMLLVSRQHPGAQWPPELMPVPHSDIPKKLAHLLDQREKDAASSSLGAVFDYNIGANTNNNTQTLNNHGNSGVVSQRVFRTAERSRREGLQVRMNINIEVARLRPQVDFPAGVEILPGVITLARPYWAMPLHNVVLVQLPESNTKDALIRLHSKGFLQVNLRSELASNQYFFVPRSAPARSIPPTQQSNSGESKSNSNSATPATTAATIDWSLPPRSIFVQLPEVFDVFSWRDVLPGVEAVTSLDELHGLALPPAHFLIQRPRHRLSEELPFGFQLGISENYRGMRLLALPPQVEIMHLLPVRYLPRGVNIINTSVLTKNTFNNHSGAMYMGLSGTNYTRKTFDPRWIPRMSPFEPISSRAVVLPWPENACRLDCTLNFFREANMLLFVRDMVNPRSNISSDSTVLVNASSSNANIILNKSRNYPGNIILQRESETVVTALTKFIGDPQRDAFLLNVPSDLFFQGSMDRGIPVCRIELVKISDGFPSPVDRLKSPQNNSHSSTNMRHLAAMNEEATVCPRITRISRQRLLDPGLELNRFLAEACVFFFGKSERDAKREADHLGFDFVGRGIDRLLESVQELKTRSNELQGDLRLEKEENSRLQEEIDCLSKQVRQLQVALQTDDDLRAIIERLKLLIEDKEKEVEQLKQQTTDVQERLQRQVEVLTSQVAQQQQVEHQILHKEQMLQLTQQHIQQQAQLAQSTDFICSVLDIYGAVVAGFVQDFVKFWCDSFAKKQAETDKLIIHALHVAHEKRQSLSLSTSISLHGSAQPEQVDHVSINSVRHQIPQLKGADSVSGAVRLASSLEDEESIGGASIGTSIKSHYNSKFSSLHLGRGPPVLTDELPLASELRALYRTSDMLPATNSATHTHDNNSSEYLQFSRAINPRSRKHQHQKQAIMSQSISLPTLQQQPQSLVPLGAVTLSKPLKFPRQSQGDADDLSMSSLVSSVRGMSAEEIGSSTQIFKNSDCANTPSVNPAELLQTVADYFSVSTDALKTRLREDPNAFTVILQSRDEAINYSQFLQTRTESLKKQTQDKCRNLLDVLCEKRDFATHNLIAALEFENQMIFFNLYTSNQGHDKIEVGGVGSQLHQESLESLDFSVSEQSLGHNERDLFMAKSTIPQTHPQTVSQQHQLIQGKHRKLHELEQNIRKYELQMFKPHLSPIENLSKELQEGHRLQQQLKLTLLLLRRQKQREEQKQQQDKQQRFKPPIGNESFNDKKNDADNLLLNEMDLKLEQESDPEKLIIASKYRLSRLGQQISQTEERLKIAEEGVKKSIFSILDHVESYQRCVQDLLPPRMFHLFLTKSAQYYDKLRNLQQDPLTGITSGSLQDQSILSLCSMGSAASVASTTSFSSQSTLRPLKTNQPKAIGGIGSMPPSNALNHLRGQNKLQPSQPVPSTFRNAASILPSLHK